MGSEDWVRYLDMTREKLKYGEEVTSLVRCSTLYQTLSHRPSLALSFVETFPVLGIASVREALQTAQNYPKHPGPGSGQS